MVVPTSCRVRLQCRPPELREGMVCAEEAMVLPQVREGLPRIWEREHVPGFRQWIWCWGTERPRRGPSRTSTLGHEVSSPGAPQLVPTSKTCPIVWKVALVVGCCTGAHAPSSGAQPAIIGEAE